MRWLPIAFAALLLGGIVSLATPRTAHACSYVGSPYEVLEVIVVGTVTDVARAPEFDRFNSTNVYRVGQIVALRVTFEVDEYLKGAGPTTLVTYERQSAYYGDGPGEQFSETDMDSLYYGGDCGSVGASPLGEYRVTGLFRSDDGVLDITGFGIFAVAASADDPAITEAIELAKQRLAALGLPFPPAAGGAGLASGRDEARLLAALLLLAVLAAAGALRTFAVRER